jgi:hypothetical protein
MISPSWHPGARRTGADGATMAMTMDPVLVKYPVFHDIIIRKVGPEEVLIIADYRGITWFINL